MPLLWPASYTRYFALGMQLSPALQSPFSFHLGCGYNARKKKKKKKKVLEKLHASFVPRFKKGMRLGACFLCSYQEFITIRGSYTLFLKLFSPASVISPSPHTSGSALCMCVCTLVCLFAAIYLLNVFHEDRAHALGKYRGRDIVQVEHQ